MAVANFSLVLLVVIEPPSSPDVSGPWFKAGKVLLLLSNQLSLLRCGSFSVRTRGTDWTLGCYSSRIITPSPTHTLKMIKMLIFLHFPLITLFIIFTIREKKETISEKLAVVIGTDAPVGDFSKEKQTKVWNHRAVSGQRQFTGVILRMRLVDESHFSIWGRAKPKWSWTWCITLKLWREL